MANERPACRHNSMGFRVNGAMQDGEGDGGANGGAERHLGR